MHSSPPPPELASTPMAPTSAAGAGEVAPSLTALLAEHQRPLWRYLRLLGADPDEADDLLQDTFVAFATRAGERPLAAPGAFLRGIARNLLLTARRKSRRRPPTDDWASAVDQLAEQHGDAFADTQVEALRDCLQRLPERARQAVQWHHVEGLSRRDTATRLGLGDEGTKSLLQRARRLLRDCLERHDRKEQNR
ncbi:MAG: sigma-70 family RNA polymerase sigma factor [Planctomycetes bacterium]|nr:sigma-70 family RNA polymerase sigma factor [Planctomycetota bacterium]